MMFSLKKFLCNLAASVCVLFLPLITNGQVSGCPKLSISGPDTVMPYGKFQVSAKIDPEQLTRDVNWLIIKENYHTKLIEIKEFEKRDELSIPVWDSNDDGLITLVSTVTFSPACEVKTAHRVYVTANPGSPLIIDEYGKINWNDERGRLDIVIAEMKNRPNQELLIYMYFRKGEGGTVRRQRISRILRHLTQFRKFDSNRITFLISTENSTKIIFQPVPFDLVDNYASESFLRIPAQKLGQYQQLFKK